MTLPALDREEALKRTGQAFFAALDDFRHKNPDAATRIDEMIAAHMRSAAPMALLDAAVPVSPVVEVSRDLADGGRYALSIAESCVVLSMTHPDLAFTPIEAFRFCADFEAVASSVKEAG